MKKVEVNKAYIIAAIVVFIVVVGGLISVIVNNKNETKTASQNTYNMAFYEVVDYVQNVETYLAKSLISNTPEHGAETLTHVWREANLAQSYLARLPIESNELSNTSKFLNQVSDYSYTLSRKNIYNEALTQEDLNNLKELHSYAIELENTLNQLSVDINDGRISWGELTKKGSSVFSQQVSNISKDSFSNLEENFHEYSGLIYDGAFSEHLTNPERKGLTGEEIDENKAKDIATQFIGKDKIKEINSNGNSENSNIPSYDFIAKLNNNEHDFWISVSKKGGHIVFMNCNRNVETQRNSNN